ncbi:MAG TPA: tetratricopeptide repeat protein [Dehalococcoidia bacterium]|nr:tetratricopeptide repeat protein [Dehalococcoidia bacterium]
MARTTKQSEPTVCRHLGLAQDPFQRQDIAAEEHRCYLWMQRDRIDVDHQNGYCLSIYHRNCPWLHISLPCHTGLKKSWTEAVNSRLDGDAWDLLLEAAGVAAQGAAWAAARLAPLIRWAAANTPRALIALWVRISPLLAAGARNLGKGAVRLLRAAFRRLRARRQPHRAQPEYRPVALEPMPAERVSLEAQDFSMLMRLGREADRAGQRKQAHLLFSKAAALNAASEEAWLWMAATTDDSEAAMASLEKALAINPTSGKARAQLADLTQPPSQAKPERSEALGLDLTPPKLIDHGISALDAEDEARAYQFFVSATEAEPGNEAAWFWRAKTAADLGEVISCLERVLEINAFNEKARASLNWALDRQQADVKRQRFVSTLPAPLRPTVPSSPDPERQHLLVFSSRAYMALGFLWAAPFLFSLLDGSMQSIYLKLAFLPVIRVPYLPPSALGLSDIPVPEANLFYAAPLFLAFLAFSVTEKLWNGGRVVSLYVALVTGASIAATGLLVVGEVSPRVMIAMSALAGLLGLAGRITLHRDSRARSAARLGSLAGSSGAAAARRRKVDRSGSEAAGAEFGLDTRIHNQYFEPSGGGLRKESWDAVKSHRPE